MFDYRALSISVDFLRIVQYVESVETDCKCCFDIHAGAVLLKCYFDIRAGADLLNLTFVLGAGAGGGGGKQGATC